MCRIQWKRAMVQTFTIEDVKSFIENMLQLKKIPSPTGPPYERFGVGVECSEPTTVITKRSTLRKASSLKERCSHHGKTCKVKSSSSPALLQKRVAFVPEPDMHTETPLTAAPSQETCDKEEIEKMSGESPSKKRSFRSKLMPSVAIQDALKMEKPTSRSPSPTGKLLFFKERLSPSTKVKDSSSKMLVKPLDVPEKKIQVKPLDVPEKKGSSLRRRLSPLRKSVSDDTSGAQDSSRKSFFSKIDRLALPGTSPPIAEGEDSPKKRSLSFREKLLSSSKSHEDKYEEPQKRRSLSMRERLKKKTFSLDSVSGERSQSKEKKKLLSFKERLGYKSGKEKKSKNVDKKEDILEKDTDLKPKIEAIEKTTDVTTKCKTSDTENTKVEMHVEQALLTGIGENRAICTLEEGLRFIDQEDSSVDEKEESIKTDLDDNKDDEKSVEHICHLFNTARYDFGAEGSVKNVNTAKYSADFNKAKSMGEGILNTAALAIIAEKVREVMDSVKSDQIDIDYSEKSIEENPEKVTEERAANFVESIMKDAIKILSGDREDVPLHHNTYGQDLTTTMGHEVCMMDKVCEKSSVTDKVLLGGHQGLNEDRNKQTLPNVNTNDVCSTHEIGSFNVGDIAGINMKDTDVENKVIKQTAHDSLHAEKSDVNPDKKVTILAGNASHIPVLNTLVKNKYSEDNIEKKGIEQTKVKDTIDGDKNDIEESKMKDTPDGNKPDLKDRSSLEIPSPILDVQPVAGRKKSRSFRERFGSRDKSVEKGKYKEKGAALKFRDEDGGKDMGDALRIPSSPKKKMSFRERLAVIPPKLQNPAKLLDSALKASDSPKSPIRRAMLLKDKFTGPKLQTSTKLLDPGNVCEMPKTPKKKSLSFREKLSPFKSSKEKEKETDKELEKHKDERRGRKIEKCHSVDETESGSPKMLHVEMKQDFLRIFVKKQSSLRECDQFPPPVSPRVLESFIGPFESLETRRPSLASSESMTESTLVKQDSASSIKSTLSRQDSLKRKTSIKRQMSEDIGKRLAFHCGECIYVKRCSNVTHIKQKNPNKNTQNLSTHFIIRIPTRSLPIPVYNIKDLCQKTVTKTPVVRIPWVGLSEPCQNHLRWPTGRLMVHTDLCITYFAHKVSSYG